MKLPFISIITPTYNRKELLEKAILSVINQKQDIPFKWEMLITDDGSTDGTKKYIQKYLDKYPKNIKYFYQENAGVGKARNTSLNNLSPNSDYTILLDSDDEFKCDLIYEGLKKRSELQKLGEYEKTLGLYFLCENEKKKVIVNKNLFSSSNEEIVFYKDFISGKISFELLIFLKSNIFNQDCKMRFEEDLISNELVLWSKMYKYMKKKGLYMIVLNKIGRVYKHFHTGETRIMKNFTKKRFLENAIGNQRILDIIGKDLLKNGLLKVYGDYLFRIGINLVLSGKHNDGLFSLKQSLKYNKSVFIFLIYFISSISPALLFKLYKRYV